MGDLHDTDIEGVACVVDSNDTAPGPETPNGLVSRWLHAEPKALVCAADSWRWTGGYWAKRPRKTWKASTGG